MMKAVAILSALFFGLTAAEIKTEEGVLVLTDSNFDEAVAANEFLLVEFYAPWCGHCKSLAPEYAAAAATLKDDDAKLAKVDATEATDLAGRFEIRGFPTLKFFRSGKAVEYNGGRTASEIVSWLRKNTGPAAKTLTSEDDLSSFQEAADAVVVGYFADVTSDNAKAFLSLAGADDVNEYGITSSDAIKAKLALTSDAVVILKSFDEKRNDFAVEGDVDNQELMKFVLTNSSPLVQVFSQQSAKKIFSSPIQTHALFFTDTSSSHHAPTVATFTEVAKQVKGQALVVNVPSSEGKVLEYFGITAADVPTMVTVDMSSEGQMKKFPYSGSMDSVADIAAHVQGAIAGDIKATLKSEAREAADTTGDVTVLRGESFQELVIDNTKDVLVEFYAPWCGHCKKLAPVWEELGKEFSSNSDIVIAKMDSTANEIDVKGVNVKGFPTIFFFPGNDKANPVKYESGRELEDISAFLKQNAFNLQAAASDEL